MSFNVALRTKLLIGPTSYSLADNPHYADAFSSRHWNPAERARLRWQKAKSGERGDIAVNAAEVVAGDDSSSESENEGPSILSVCTHDLGGSACTLTP